MYVRFQSFAHGLVWRAKRRMGEGALARRLGWRCEPAVWFEVEEFLAYFGDYPHPTGIQRVSLEIYAQLGAQGGRGGRIRFCRVARQGGGFEPVDLRTMLAAHGKGSSRAPPPSAPPPPPPPPQPSVPAAPRDRIGELIAAVRIRWLRHELTKFRGTLRRCRWFFGRMFPRLSAPRPRRPSRPVVPRASRPPVPKRLFRPGDVLVCLGASWAIPNHGALVAAAKRECGVKFMALIYDVLPVTHRRYFAPPLADAFAAWLVAVVGNADRLLAISRYTRRSLIELAAGAGAPLPPVAVLPLGAGFRRRQQPRLGAAARLPLALPERFVLFVSSFEPRKNHALLFRLWARLIERHGAEAVPELVLVGRRFAEFAAPALGLVGAAGVAGKIRLVPDLSDDALDEVYRRCLLTVYPSLVEGWGLPLAESLSHGKLCVASDRGSLPEVAGELVDYFDPADEAGALARIERAIFDAAYRQARERRIRAEYRPASWADCVRVLLREIDALAGVGAGQDQPDRSRLSG
jgi:glycosyltransferase involved in cell wall biosynthesis